MIIIKMRSVSTRLSTEPGNEAMVDDDPFRDMED